MKPVFKIISIAFILLWVVVIGICIVGRITYTPPANEEKFGVAFDKGIYSFFIIMSIFGMLSTVEFSLAIHRFLENTKSLPNKISLGLSILTNILLYTFIVLAFTVNSDAMLGLLTAWIVSGLICLISLLIAKWLDNRNI